MYKRVFTAFGYIFLTLLVVGVTAGLVAYGEGYRYSLKESTVYRTGLILIKTQPSGLVVKLDRKPLGHKSPTNVSRRGGTYTVSINKTGFHPWTKAVTVVSSQVESLQYVIMLALDMPRTILDSRAQIIAQSVSSDRRHLAYVTGGSDPAIYTLDTSNQNAAPVRLYQPRPATETAPAETLTDVAWSDDASHLLIVSKVGEVVTHRLASAGGGEPVNLTSTYGFNFTGLRFSGSNWQQLYWISPDGLRRLDVGAQAVSGVLADKVSQFVVAGNRILYVQKTELGQTLWSTDARGRRQELIPALPESDGYAIDTARFNNNDYLAVVPAKTGVGTIYAGIYDANPTSQVLARNVTTPTFAPDGHLLAFSSPTGISVYDLERFEVEKRSVVYPFPTPAGLSAVTWFDSFHLLMTATDRVVWSDFDGQNQVVLGPGVPGFASYPTSDGKSVVGFSTTPSGTRINLTSVRP